jgi:hypothetical protein
VPGWTYLGGYAGREQGEGRYRMVVTVSPLSSRIGARSVHPGPRSLQTARPALTVTGLAWSLTSCGSEPWRPSVA